MRNYAIKRKTIGKCLARTWHVSTARLDPFGGRMSDSPAATDPKSRPKVFHLPLKYVIKT
jgi:hypothetical protein